MKIGEVATKAGVTNRAVRYYEELNLIKSDRLSNNYREYSEEALDKVKFISVSYTHLTLPTNREV